MKKANKKFDFSIESYGIYTRWNRNSRDLPEIVKFTNEVPAETDAEFGMILRIKKGKGVLLDFTIDHPPFMDDSGKISPSFSGQQLVTSNDYLFFIGDCIWEPVDDKKGLWTVTVEHKGKLLTKKEFDVQ